MRIPKVVTFKVVFIEKLKSLFRPSEGYLEPGRIFTIKLLVASFCKKSSVVDVGLDSKYKFMSLFFQPHSLHLYLSLFNCVLMFISVSF